MTLKLAIPVHASVDDGELVGTAFLGSVGGRLFIITAAHVPVGAQPTNDWSRYARELKLILSEGAARATLVLFFEDGQGCREPQFGYIGASSGAIADVMWYPLGGQNEAVRVLTAEYAVHAIPESFTAAPVWTANGYPGSHQPWPPVLQTVTGRALGAVDDGHMFEALIPSEPGFSGGPVIDPSGLLVGMIAGKDGVRTNVARIVPSNVIHALIVGWQPPIAPAWAARSS